MEPPEELNIRLPWSRSERPIPRLLLRPLRRFLEVEAASGVLLLLAAAVALIWANSPWKDSYAALWHTQVGLAVGDWSIGMDLSHWVSEGLMAVFFFVVGLEVKREFATGELRNPRAAALPVVAALGGMLVPAAIYLALNAGGPGSRGWGIPMATDIAFSLGVLTIAGRRLPGSLKAFLLTLAIADDIGAIAVIAIFYTDTIAMASLAAAVALLVVFAALYRLGVRATLVFVAVGAGVWLCTYEAGIHATIAGAALGMLVPARSFQRPRAVSEEAERIADQTEDDPEPPDADAPQWLRLAELSREAVSPLVRAETVLHPWSSFVIVPLFALSAAGVTLEPGAVGDSLTGSVGLGILLGLVLGKTVGITAGAWIAVRMGGALPEGVRWPHVVATGLTAGIGFTVALFITDLAFPDSGLEDAAKVAILVASLVAGLGGGLALWRLGRREPVPEAG